MDETERILKENEEEYCLLLEATQRPGIKDFMWYLKTSDFFTAPASATHHGAYYGGLVEHHLNVYEMIMAQYGLYKRQYPNLADIPNDSLTIAALLHDINKINRFKTEIKNQKQNGRWVERQVWVVDDQFPMGHSAKSLYTAMQYITLTNVEAAAIYWHMGPYDTSTYSSWNDNSKSWNDNLLGFLLHSADMAATYILENKNIWIQASTE